MYLMIDNYDSFVYNLKAYFEELGKEIAVIRCDKITLEEIEDMQPAGIILSPGPKRPQDATLCIDIVEKFQEKIPFLSFFSFLSSALKITLRIHNVNARHNGKNGVKGPAQKAT